jgi:hypothetical protein
METLCVCGEGNSSFSLQIYFLINQKFRAVKTVGFTNNRKSYLPVILQGE